MPRIERMTDRSRKIVRIAEREAEHRAAKQVEPEHLLLALAIEGHGVAANVLRNLGAVIVRIERELPPASLLRTASDRLSWSEAAEQVVQDAQSEAIKLQHNYIGTEHLLIAVAFSERPAIARLWSQLELTPDGIRAEVYDLLGHGTP